MTDLNVSNHTAAIEVCIHCGYNEEGVYYRNCIGFTRAPYISGDRGMAFVWECPKCFGVNWFHIFSERSNLVEIYKKKVSRGEFIPKGFRY